MEYNYILKKIPVQRHMQREMSATSWKLFVDEYMLLHKKNTQALGVFSNNLNNEICLKILMLLLISFLQEENTFLMIYITILGGIVHKVLLFFDVS